MANKTCDLYFKRSNGERVLLGHPQTPQECMKMINEHLKNFPHFKSYYTRIWTVPDDEYFHCPVTWFDVGSHSEFFCCVGLDMKEFAKDRDNGKKA